MKAAPRPCTYPGCPVLVDSGRCAKHDVDKLRLSSSARGYDRNWSAYRYQLLCENPFCVRCAARGDLVVATVVDHIIPHKGDRGLFWDPTNHQALCKRCHDIKTATEDGGGFGHAHGASR